LLIHEEKNPPEWRVYRVKKDHIGALARYVAISSAGSSPLVAHTGWVALSNRPLRSGLSCMACAHLLKTNGDYTRLRGDTPALAATVIAG
jgi:hypothetical protein